ncbi:MAG: AlpA family phage regulatory protein [Steroidobacteraceae bacterium]
MPAMVPNPEGTGPLGTRYRGYNSRRHQISGTLYGHGRRWSMARRPSFECSSQYESKNQFAFNLEPPVKPLRDPNERALRLRQVTQLTGLGRSVIYLMQAEGRFPQRIKLAQISSIPAKTAAPRRPHR